MQQKVSGRLAISWEWWIRWSGYHGGLDVMIRLRNPMSPRWSLFPSSISCTERISLTWRIELNPMRNNSVRHRDRKPEYVIRKWMMSTEPGPGYNKRGSKPMQNDAMTDLRRAKPSGVSYGLRPQQVSSLCTQVTLAQSLSGISNPTSSVRGRCGCEPGHVNILVWVEPQCITGEWALFLN